MYRSFGIGIVIVEVLKGMEEMYLRITDVYMAIFMPRQTFSGVLGCCFRYPLMRATGKQYQLGLRNTNYSGACERKLKEKDLR